jgi:hypothetical protein
MCSKRSLGSQYTCQETRVSQHVFKYFNFTRVIIFATTNKEGVCNNCLFLNTLDICKEKLFTGRVVKI